MAKMSGPPEGSRGSNGRGPFIFKDYKDNHVIWPGRDDALGEFVAQTYGGLRHKHRNAHSSNSEDALTWSCFDAIRQIDVGPRAFALGEIWKLAFDRDDLPAGVETGKIHIGKCYGDTERTEADVSIEGPGVLIFFEAKLYSPMSQADLPTKPHNPIARKLRVGAREAVDRGVEFFFILLDIAPMEALNELNRRTSLADAGNAKASGFGSKWLTSYWYARYKYGRNGSIAPLREVLDQAPPIVGVSAVDVARNMGWITWADVFKVTLRAVLAGRIT